MIAAIRQHPTPWTWEEHELPEGFSCIVYDARGTRVGRLDHLDADTASVIVDGVNALMAPKTGRGAVSAIARLALARIANGDPEPVRLAEIALKDIDTFSGERR